MRERFAAWAEVSGLILMGPPANPSVPLILLAAGGRLRGVVSEVSFRTWEGPERLEELVSSGWLHAAQAPINAAAALYRKGLGVRLLNVNVWGGLCLLAAGDGMRGWDDLGEGGVAVPFRGNVPDLVFRYLAKQAGVNEQELEPRYAASPVEALRALLGGEVRAAVLPEPLATAAELRGDQRDLEVRRVLDLRQEWGRLTGGPGRIPQAGMFAVESLVNGNPELVRELQAGFAEAVEQVSKEPREAARAAAEHLGLEASLIEKSLPNTPMEVVPAAQAREEVEAFFTRMEAVSPGVIGEELPDDGFYYVEQ